MHRVCVWGGCLCVVGAYTARCVSICPHVYADAKTAGVDSLNVSVAAGVLLFQLLNQTCVRVCNTRRRAKGVAVDDAATDGAAATSES